MDSLPTEILGLILEWEVRMCERQKNTILNLRLVCKAFDMALRTCAFRTIQLEFSRFLRHAPTPDVKSLVGVGGICEALYLDMMVVRDEEEISRLSSVFHGLLRKVPEMIPLLDSLRRYCLNDSTFDETDFRRVTENVLEHTPNLKRLKLNLPFQVVGQTSRTATVLLATTLACLAQRPEEHTLLQTMVLDHVSDTTLIDICHNPMDLNNAITTFSHLKHLVLSIKRQESLPSTQSSFSNNLWFLIEKATPLESLCLIGWNIRRDIKTRRHCHNVSYNHWTMRSLPFSRDVSDKLTHLRNLELKRIDIDPHIFVDLITQVAPSLKELYLNQVYLKIRAPQQDSRGLDLWVGGVGRKKEETCWVAEDLRAIPELKLDILRATGIGYDDFLPVPDEDYPTYDLVDPTGHSRSFDQRFVSAVLSGPDPSPENQVQPQAQTDATTTPEPTATPLTLHTTSPTLQTQSHTQPQLPPSITHSPTPTSTPHPRASYDAETFQRTHHNSTSELKRSIDGYFINHNEQALKELQNIITVADRGMNMLSAEIERARMEGEMVREGG
ncbi:hypothetical protein ONS95_005215 [Cadophora gregata]|uniref:uncharacterized protein n=1 Tax=Cadophora gregata TaxID=51156 RepID=UPI0026DAAAB9|nr:uncharacterized protein ONS95_005215 [Cadophora gregata]KAK0104954.1 hypothetical protein ONS95_005215 [Cadophora gregata]KAK0114964.1 hypothetical protein ONS96_013438 [Cadophora gregata f. sp. sojae]